MRNFLEKVTGAIGLGGAKRAGSGVLGNCMVFAHIEEPLMPLQRGSKYEDPLNRALAQARLGRVTGGGSVQGIDGSIEWVSLDLQLVDLGPSLDFVRDKLKELGAPRGSVLKFKKGEVVTTLPIG
ncbi:MAG: hypothetical protein IPL39_17685 [Opitutaceae bacterium]|nr:hypothetical protein [Opitutaceae bacterium]